MSMTTKERGDQAVGQAINYFISSGYEVCLPIGDKRAYDMVVEKNSKLERVQIKFAGLYKATAKCKVGLRITGGNQSFNYSKKYSADDFDALFVYTARGDRFFIPWSAVDCRNEISIETAKYAEFRV